MIAHIPIAKDSVVQPVIRHGHQQPCGQMLPAMDSPLEKNMVFRIPVTDANHRDFPALFAGTDGGYRYRPRILGLKLFHVPDHLLIGIDIGGFHRIQTLGKVAVVLRHDVIGQNIALLSTVADLGIFPIPALQLHGSALGDRPDHLTAGCGAQTDILLAVGGPYGGNRRIEEFIDWVILSVRKMPPLRKVGGKPVLFHGFFQQSGVCCGLMGTIAVIPVRIGSKIVVSCGNRQFRSGFQIVDGNIHGIAPAVGPLSGHRMGNKGGIGTDLPKLCLGRNGAEAIPNDQANPLFSQLFTDFHQFFHRSVAEIRIREVIDPVSGEIVRGSIGQFHPCRGDVVRDPDKFIILRFPGRLGLPGNLRWAFRLRNCGFLRWGFGLRDCMFHRRFPELLRFRFHTRRQDAAGKIHCEGDQNKK